MNVWFLPDDCRFLILFFSEFFASFFLILGQFARYGLNFFAYHRMISVQVTVIVSSVVIMNEIVACRDSSLKWPIMSSGIKAFLLILNMTLNWCSSNLIVRKLIGDSMQHRGWAPMQWAFAIMCSLFWVFHVKISATVAFLKFQLTVFWFYKTTRILFVTCTSCVWLVESWKVKGNRGCSNHKDGVKFTTFKLH